VTQPMGPDPFAREGTALAGHEEADRAELEGWCRRTLDQLGLRDWRLIVSPHEPTSSGANAEAFFRDDAREVVLAISARWYDYGERDRRATLTHECLHPVLHPLVQQACEVFDRSCSPEAAALAGAALAHAEELSVDTLAHALAELLPPIELPSGR
jgi:hypothetical protein